MTVGCLNDQMPNSSWCQPCSTEKHCSAAGGTSSTCLDMSEAPIRDEKRGSTSPLSQSGPRGRLAASGSELVTTALLAVRVCLTASPLLPLQKSTGLCLISLQWHRHTCQYLHRSMASQ